MLFWYQQLLYAGNLGNDDKNLKAVMFSHLLLKVGWALLQPQSSAGMSTDAAAPEHSTHTSSALLLPRLASGSTVSYQKC